MKRMKTTRERRRRRGVALLMAIFFMVAMFFLTFAFIKLLPVQANYAYQDYNSQRGSLAAEAGIIDAIARMQDDSWVPAPGDNTGTVDLQNNWVTNYVVDPVPGSTNTLRIVATASLYGDDVLVATAQVENEDLFLKMVNGDEVQMDLNHNPDVANLSKFTGPIHGNSKIEVDLEGGYVLANPGPLFTNSITSAGTGGDSDPDVTGVSDWNLFIEGGSSSVSHTPDTVDTLEFKDAQDSVVNGSSNADSLANQALNGAIVPGGTEIMLPPGGGVYLDVKFEAIVFGVDGSGNSEIKFFKSPTASPFSDTPDYVVVFDETANWTTVYDGTGGVVDAGQAGMTNGIIYSTQQIADPQGVFKGNYTLASADKIRVGKGGGSGETPSQPASLTPYGVTPGDENTSGYGMSLVAAGDVRIRPFRGGSGDKKGTTPPPGTDYYLYANLLADDVKIKSHDTGGLTFELWGSVMAQNKATFDIHGSGSGKKGGTDAGDFSILWDLNNLSVVGLSAPEFKLVHYEHRQIRD